MNTEGNSAPPASDDVDSLVRELVRVGEENAALRIERDELRGMLGMAPGLRDAHRASTAPTIAG